MFEIIRSVKGLLKSDSVIIDNKIFRLHYVTTFILLAFSLFVTSNQYIGDPIDCIIDGIPSNVIDAYCWIYGTYTIPNKFRGVIGRDIIYPGVGNGLTPYNDVKYHKYYQWVYVVLFFQAILFYTPRYLWKMWEGNRIRSITRNSGTCTADAEKRNKIITYYLLDNLGRNNFYMYRFIICELLNFGNVLGQMALMDYFLGSEFSTYGIDVLNLTELKPELRQDPMAAIFPKITKCTFNKYGASGSIQNYDGLCILPMNVVNEKIYLFLWFWFIILAILSGLAIMYRVIILCIPKSRLYVLRMQSKCRSHTKLEKILKKLKVGDWFLLYQISKNLDEIIFEKIVFDLAVEMYAGGP